MEPPICDVCDEPFNPADGGRRVRFVPTDAGRAFEQRVTAEGIVGDHPDEGWFCDAVADGAEALAPTHTRREAIEALRSSAPSPRKAGRDEYERRQRTRVVHELPTPVSADGVRTAIRLILDELLPALGLDELEPTTTRTESSAPSPEPRDAIGTSTLDTREMWRSTEHHIEVRVEDTHWDSWSGTPRGGDLFQGLVTLTVDDTWLHAPFSADGLVGAVTESGVRTPAASHLVDQLLELLRGH